MNYYVLNKEIKITEKKDTITKNPFKKFLCWMDWHGPRTHSRMKGYSIYAKCNWCGCEGKVNHQGDLVDVRKI